MKNPKKKENLFVIEDLNPDNGGYLGRLVFGLNKGNYYVFPYNAVNGVGAAKNKIINDLIDQLNDLRPDEP